VAHEITIRADGRAEAFYGMNNPAWHNLGTVVAGTLASAEAIKAAGLDWEVKTEPVYTSDMQPVEGWQRTFRSDNRETLGVVTDGYEVVQNSEAFDFVDGLAQDGIMQYETAMSLRGGRVVVLLAKMPQVFEIVAGDKVAPYILLATGHDGGRGISVMPTAVRVVCANTLRAAESAGAKRKALSMKHTRSIKERLTLAQRLITAAGKSFEANIATARQMCGRQISDAMFYQYVGKLWPKPEASAGERTHGNYSRAMRSLEANYFRDAKQQIAGIARTPWAAYNAVSQYIDHPTKTPEQYKRERQEGSADRTRRRENHFTSTMMGTGADFKMEAYELAQELATA
jgi:phage/plasmid-like protein (TIGR03299 family)